MKKILLILLTVVFGLSFTSCEGIGGKATVEVQVIKSNMPQSGMSVYMFDNTKWTMDIREPLFANKTVITDASGIATFELGDMDLVILDSQTTLYFATFKDGTEIMTGQTAVTIKKGETKQATIRL